jgi:hypothetical protein
MKNHRWCVSLLAIWLFCAVASRAQQPASEVYQGTDADAEAHTWINVNAIIDAAGGASYETLARDLHSAVYDAGTNKMILFGGEVDGPTFENLNDVWALTNANGLGGTPKWTNLIQNGASDSPPARHGQAAVYDAANDRMMIFGGCKGGCYPITSPGEVWVLANASGSGGTPTWEQLSISGSAPASRTGAAAVYDPTTNSMIIFGGQNGSGSGGQFSDTWVLSNANGLGGTPAWKQLSPTGGPPPGQYYPSAIYDSVNNIMVVMGGNGHGAADTPTNAVWALSHANGQGGTPVWTNLVAEGAPGSPSRRSNHTAVYDPESNRMIVFAGGTMSSPYVANDAWVLSHANGLGGTPSWKELSPSGGLPAPRHAHTAAYDATNNRMVIFGGSGFEGQFWSTWVLTNANGK